MAAEHADVIVVGMGVGGEEVAGNLAEHGLDVVGIERDLVGGECPYWGCIPTKMIIRAANALAEARRIPDLAGGATVHPSWAPVARRIRDEATDSWDDRVAVERFEKKGGRFVRGSARLVAPGRVAVGGTTFEASRGVVVATGTRAAIPPVPGLPEVAWTNRDAVAAESLPGSMLVLGGGAVGLELAQAFARFGVEVTVVEAEARLLPAEEPDTGALIERVLTAEGVAVHTGTHVEAVRRDDPQVVADLDTGAQLRAEKLLVAAGRRADLRELGVAAVGLDEHAPAVAVDGRMRTGERLWAIGDVTGVGAFTHVAVYQARIAAADILGVAVQGADYRALPRVTFTDPEVASVGLGEEAARASGLRVRVGVSQVPSSARGWIHKVGNEGFVKLVEDADRASLVGATSVGPHGGEVLAMLVLAVHAQIPTAELAAMIYAYPTFHRGVEDALRDLTAG